MRYLLLLFVFAPLAPAADPPSVTAQKNKDSVVFFENGPNPINIITEYRYAGMVKVPAKDKVGEKELAKPFFWPLFAPGGERVTRSWPVALDSKDDSTIDHIHQKSVWFCHGDVIPDLELKVKSADKRVHGIDFWAEGGNHGRIVCTEVGEPKQVSKTHVSVATKNEWRASDGTKVLDEARTIHVMTFPEGRLIVLDIDLHASVCGITFGDTKEGSMGVRVNDLMRTTAPSGGTVTSSDGKVVPQGTKDNLPVWGQIADWNDYSGTVNGKAVGIAIFADPKNASPSAWHTRAYGLMAANPFGRKDSGFPSQKGKTDLVKLAKGDHLKLRFGVFAHSGDATAGKVAEVFKQFVGK